MRFPGLVPFVLVAACGSAGQNTKPYETTSGADRFPTTRTPTPVTGSTFSMAVAQGTVGLDTPEMPLSMAITADVDGDGIGDLAVANYTWSAGGQSIAFYAGRVDGGYSTDRVGTIIGPADPDGLGEFAHFVSTGDLDGDGILDLAVGGSQHDTKEGKLYVFLGANLSLGCGVTVNASTADLILVGPERLSGYGFVSDLDGDGLSDLVFGSSEGAKVVFSSLIGLGTVPLSASNSLNVTGVGTDALGTAFAAGDNVDGSGNPGLLFGASMLAGQSGGAVLVPDPFGLWTASPQGVSATAVGIALESDPGDNAGRVVAGGGDVDGDGRGDFLISAPSHDNTPPMGFDGAAWLVRSADLTFTPGTSVYLGSVAGRILPTAEDDQMGWQVAFVRDIDNDGLSDVMVSAPADHGVGNSWDLGSGAVYIFPSADGLPAAGSSATVPVGAPVVHGTAETGYIGWCVTVGDGIDDDSSPDVAIVGMKLDTATVTVSVF